MGKSKAVKILNLPPEIRQLFRRALALRGQGSQSQWVQAQIRRFIRETQGQFGDNLFDTLTAEESDLVQVISDGAAEIQQIKAESLLREERVDELIEVLIRRGVIEKRRKGGKTHGARGAVIEMYFVVGSPSGSDFDPGNRRA